MKCSGLELERQKERQAQEKHRNPIRYLVGFFFQIYEGIRLSCIPVPFISFHFFIAVVAFLFFLNELAIGKTAAYKYMSGE